MTFQKLCIHVLLGLIAGIHTALAENCTSVGQACSSDCVTLITCIDVNVPPVYSHRCENPTPYCLNSRCSISPNSSAECQTPTDDFKCTGSGVYPDPQDCTRYHVCLNSSSKAETINCPSSFVYSPRERLCRFGNSKDCPTLTKTCANPRNANRLVRYSNDAPGYFGFCSTTSAPVVFRCKDDLNEIYDEQQSSCRYDCRRDGQFVNRFDCNGFVQCFHQNGRWTPQEFGCPGNYSFSAGTCVPENGTPCISELTE